MFCFDVYKVDCRCSCVGLQLIKPVHDAEVIVSPSSSLSWEAQLLQAVQQDCVDSARVWSNRDLAREVVEHVRVDAQPVRRQRSQEVVAPWRLPSNLGCPFQCCIMSFIRPINRTRSPNTNNWCWQSASLHSRPVWLLFSVCTCPWRL